MRLSLLPRERQFFVLFRENAATLMESLTTLNTLLRGDPRQFSHYASMLQELEHQADEITHRIGRELNSTFITPFDREDILALAAAVDDVIDLTEETADTIVLDCVGAMTAEARQMGEILVQIGEELVRVFDRLESRRNMTESYVRIHALENQADSIIRGAIGQLFSSEQDPIDIIRWKDVYRLLEKTVDRTEDVANVLESVAIKNN